MLYAIAMGQIINVFTALECNINETGFRDLKKHGDVVYAADVKG